MPFGNQSADFFVLLKMDMTCHKDITIFRMIIMISQDDLDHRLLPEIIHGGYDGPLSDECWKGHGLLGLQFRCFFPPSSLQQKQDALQHDAIRYVFLSCSHMPSSVDAFCSTVAPWHLNLDLYSSR